MKEKYLFNTVMTLLILLILTILFGSYLLFIDGSNVAKFNNLPFPVDKTVYSPGDSVFYTFDFCRNRDVVGQVNWELITETVAQSYPPVFVNTVDVGCAEGNAPLVLPEIIVDGGVSYFKGTVSYKVNFLRTVTYDIRTENFFIMEVS